MRASLTIAFCLVSTTALSQDSLTTLAEELLSLREMSLEGDEIIVEVLRPETAGLQAARERGYLRMAVAPDPLMIAFDGEEALGVAIDIGTEFEAYLAGLPGASATPTVVVPTPMPRRQIISGLIEGTTDFTTLTMTTAEALPELTYTRPLVEDVRDVLVLGPGVAGVESLDDMGEIPVYVSEDSRQALALEQLNAERRAGGQRALDLRFVDARLDDHDLIELVEVGLLPATVASNFKADFWATVYTEVTVRHDLPLSEAGQIVWAARDDNPELAEALDGFAEIARQGTLLGNIVLDRYTSSADWIVNIDTEESRRRIDEVGPVIARFSEEYGLEGDLVLAQAYQESRLDQSAVSHVGAQGVMQLMPTTAADPVVGIPDVSTVENNVHAGVRYLRWLQDTFYDDPAIDPLDRTLLAFAAYNAGPGGVERARTRAVEMGLDPNVWFENVEVAIQSAVSREPAKYVRNIFKYYVSYRLLQDIRAGAEGLEAVLDDLPEDIGTLPEAEREALLEAVESGGSDG